MSNRDSLTKQQLNKSIQRIFSSTKRKELTKNSYDSADQHIQDIQNQQISNPQYYSQQIKIDFNLHNDQNINIKMNTSQKKEKFYSEDSASDYSPVMKPSLPQTPTNQFSQQTPKNPINSFTNNNKMHSNINNQSLKTLPTTSIQNPETPQKTMQNFTQHDNSSQTQNNSKQSQDKSNFFSHFRNYSTPDLIQQKQEYIQQGQQVTKKDQFLGDLLKQKQQFISKKQSKQNVNNQIEKELSQKKPGAHDIQKQTYMQIFTNSLIQSKVTSPQRTPKSNISQNQKINIPQQKYQNQQINLVQPYGIHLFHNRNQSIQQPSCEKQDFIKGMNSSVLSLNNIQPNLFYVDSSYKMENKLLQIMKQKKPHNSLINLKDNTQNNQNKKPIFFQPQHYQSKQLLLNKGFKYLPQTPLKTQQITDKSKEFNRLLSQTFKFNFQEYNAQETGMTKRLIAHIRQKSAKSQSANISYLNDAKNASQQISLDDFEDFILKVESQKKDSVINDPQLFDNAKTSAINTIVFDSDKQTGQDKLNKQDKIPQRVFITISEKKRSSLAHLSQIDEQETAQLIQPQTNSIKQQNIQNFRQLFSGNKEKRRILSKTVTNFSTKSNQNETNQVSSLIRLEHNIQTNQLKKLNENQQLALQKEIASTKSSTLENKKNQTIQFQNVSQKLFTNQSNPFYQLSSKAYKNYIQQKQNLLKKDIFITKMQNQQKQQECLNQQLENKLSMKHINKIQQQQLLQ